MNNQNISNLITIKPEKLFILGFYPPEDFYYAHLLEHYLAVDLGKRNLLKINHANSGSGYIFIDGAIRDVKKLNNVLKNIAFFSVDPNSLNHQKKIVLTEKFYRYRLNLDRDIYESLETNSCSQSEKDKLLDEFSSCEGEALKKKIISLFHNICWIIFDENYDFLDIQKIIKQLPKNQENNFKFVSKKAIKEYSFAEIDIVTRYESKIMDIVLYIINKKILYETQDMALLFGTHTIHNGLAKTWNKRDITHYSGYFPRSFVSDFFDFVIEKWENINLDYDDKAVIKKLINKYIRNRSKSETVMEMAEYNCLIDKNWEEKFDLDAIVLVILSNLKIYKRVQNIKYD